MNTVLTPCKIILLFYGTHLVFQEGVLLFNPRRRKLKELLLNVNKLSN